MIVGYKLVNEKWHDKKIPKPYIGCSLPKKSIYHRDSEGYLQKISYHSMYFKVDTWYEKKHKVYLDCYDICSDRGFHYFSALNKITTISVSNAGYGIADNPQKNIAIWRILIDEEHGYYKGEEKSICKCFKFVQKVCSLDKYLYNYTKRSDIEKDELGDLHEQGM